MADLTKAANTLSKTMENKISIAEFASMLFGSRTQAHIFHLQTNSFAAHKALNEYYDEIVGLTDSIIEEQQGKTGIIKGYKCAGDPIETTEYVKYFEGLRQSVNTSRYVAFKKEDTNIQNTIDEVVSLLDSTIYKLKFLK